MNKSVKGRRVGEVKDSEHPTVKESLSLEKNSLPAEKTCFVCGKNHTFKDCPMKEDVKALVIARLKQMPDNMRIAIA